LPGMGTFDSLVPRDCLAQKAGTPERLTKASAEL
jgi:hypothetical protein